jgi:hypothetical protein
METIQYQKLTKANKDHKCNFCCQIIDKGGNYLKSTHVCDGHLYEWKSHIYCSKIASKLRMYDDVDDGVTDEHFQETIRCNYQDIMSEHHNELYKSKDFVYPEFSEQLDFLLNHYGISKGETPQPVDGGNEQKYCSECGEELTVAERCFNYMCLKCEAISERE